MKPYLNLALLSLDWLDHGREGIVKTSQEKTYIINHLISSKVSIVLM